MEHFTLSAPDALAAQQISIHPLKNGCDYFAACCAPT